MDKLNLGFLLGAFIPIVSGFAFLMGGIVSNGLQIAIAIASVSLYVLSNGERVGRWAIVAGLTFLMGVAWFSVVIVGSFDGELGSGGILYYPLAYLRGLLILTACYFLSRTLGDVELMDAVAVGYALVFLTVFLSFIMNYIAGTVTVTELVLDRHGGRAYSGFTGLFHNPNYWALYSLSGLIFLLRAAGGSRFSAWIRAGIWALGLAIAVNIVVTGSRMGMIGVVIIVIGFALLSKSFRWLSVISSVAVIGYIAVSPQGLERLAYVTSDLATIEKSVERFTRVLSAPHEEDRLRRQGEIIDRLGKEPFTFLVGGQLAADYGVGSPHNTFVNIILHMGIIGLLFLVGMFFIAYVRAGSSWRSHDQLERGVRTIAFITVIWVGLTNDVLETRAVWLLVFLATCRRFLPQRHVINSRRFARKAVFAG